MRAVDRRAEFAESLGEVRRWRLHGCIGLSASEWKTLEALTVESLNIVVDKNALLKLAKAKLEVVWRRCGVHWQWRTTGSIGIEESSGKLLMENSKCPNLNEPLQCYIHDDHLSDTLLVLVHLSESPSIQLLLTQKQIRKVRSIIGYDVTLEVVVPVIYTAL